MDFRTESSIKQLYQFMSLHRSHKIVNCNRTLSRKSKIFINKTTCHILRADEGIRSARRRIMWYNVFQGNNLAYEALVAPQIRHAGGFVKVQCNKAATVIRGHPFISHLL